MKPTNRVLVADDNPAIGEILLSWLKTLGHEARLVTDGREALQALDREPWDLVLMDCQMPDIDGFEATRRLRRLGHLLPVVAFTAMPGNWVERRCLAAGMDDFLPKPCELAELRAVLDRWLSGVEALPRPVLQSKR